ncbi:substrate-binding domain-containing protein [Cohnella xylanilytica]|uniref:Substrate-binding domain-containing protein n=1 Tax=Cohnella xylanilytica TaxID=557555 RepID=A0A841TW84_9BACL|nr:substrate-binding domain-containing protein [Cohnella xylanilytica]MBB6692445.1 substrate-binding domain-containing protein [Cohnella xylanilytica]
MRRGRQAGLVALAVLLAAAAVAGSVRWAQAKWLSPSGPVVYIPKTIDPRIEFWQAARQGVDAAAKELGTEVLTLGTDKEKDIDGQIALVERAIGMRPKAIVLSATDYERLVPVAKKIRSARIPLVIIDSGINGDYALSLIATDNFEAGRKVGDALKELLPEGGEVGVVNFIKASSTAIERENGVLASLREGRGGLEEGAASGIGEQASKGVGRLPGASSIAAAGRVESGSSLGAGSDEGQVYEIVPTVYSEGLIDKAYEVTKALLRERPGLAGIAALNEPSTVGAARAIEEAGAAGRVKLVGFDSSTSEIDYLEREVLQAIVVQKPFNMGYLAIKTAMQAYRGRKVDPSIGTGSVVITKKNMFSRENQKLLFPFLDGSGGGGG